MLSPETLNNLTELRSRLIYCVISYLILFSVFFYCSHNIFNFLSTPLLKFLPTNSSLIATNVTTPVIMPIKLALNLALFTSLPIVFYNLWQFISPGLYTAEKKNILPLVMVSLFLFFIGIIFAYYFILPTMFSFFIVWLPPSVAIMADINSYLDFIFNMFITFGIIFEIPLVIITLFKLNIINIEQLVNYRKYFILLSFIIAMMLTPPDVLSMILLAIPICLLYEIGLIIIKKFL